MRRLGRRLRMLLSVVITVVIICVLVILLVFVLPLAIQAHQADENTAAMRRLIDTELGPGATVQAVRAFVRRHQTVTLPHGRFVEISGDTPFVHVPRYDPTDGEDQRYPGGAAMFAAWVGPGGEDLDVTLFFDRRGHLVRHSVEETWLHMP